MATTDNHSQTMPCSVTNLVETLKRSHQSVRSSCSQVALRVISNAWLNSCRLSELLHMLDDYSDVIDQVVLFTGYTHSPVPLEIIRERACKLQEIMPRMKDLGMQVGINHQMTLGCINENLSNALHKPWQRMMNFDGNTEAGCYCPNDRDMRKYIADSYAALTESDPDFIWIDDDVRMEAHGTAVYGCFCDTCMDQFSAYTGNMWNRDALNGALNSGTMEERIALRIQWIEHKKELIKDITSLIRKSVDNINPNLVLGLMSGEVFYSGQGYNEWLDTLSNQNGLKVMYRPGGGFYIDSQPIVLLSKAHSIGRQISRIPPSVTDIQSEVENFPYQTLEKSVKIVGVESCAYIAAGCTGTALNLMGATQDPFTEYQRFLEGTRANRAFYEKAASTFGRSSCEGIWHAVSPDYFATINADSEWLSGSPWLVPPITLKITELGLPPSYTREAASFSILSDDDCLAFRNEELVDILSGGVMLDAGALRRLNELGLSDLTGFEVYGSRDVDTIEVFTSDPANGSSANWHRDCRQSFFPETAYLIRAANERCRILSTGIDYGGIPLGNLSGVFENRLGGRVHIGGYYPWSGMHVSAKVSQLKSLCRWLSYDSIPAYATSFHKLLLWCRRDPCDNIAMMLINPSLDDADGVCIHVLGGTDEIMLTRINCSTDRLYRRKMDGPYSIYEIDNLSPWEVVLLTCI